MTAGRTTLLAPLENRSLIEREGEPALTAEQGNALRQARRELRRSAALAARKIVSQENEILRLRNFLESSQERVAALESGQAIVELGRRLMILSLRNDELQGAAERLWTLDKTLAAAHAECERLGEERDQLAARLARRRRAPPSS